MNQDYLRPTGAAQLLTFFVVGPVVAAVIAYATWRGKPRNFSPQRYGMVCVASGAIASLLLGFAKWINADVRAPQYFLQLACVLVSGLLFGVLMGSGFSMFLCLWGWHKATRLREITGQNDS